MIGLALGVAKPTVLIPLAYDFCMVTEGERERCEKLREHTN